MRAGRAAGAPVQRGQQRSRPSWRPTSCRWCRRCGSTDTRAGVTRAVPAAPRSAPCSARSWSPASAGRADARPAAATRPRRAWVRPGSRRRSGTRALMAQSGQAGGDPVDFLAAPPAGVPGSCRPPPRAPWPGTRRCRAWPVVPANSFCAAARSFSSLRRSAATSTVPEVSSSTTTVPPRQPHLDRCGRGEVLVTGSVSQASARHRRRHGRPDPRCRCRTAGQAPAGGRPDPGRCGTGAPR